MKWWRTVLTRGTTRMVPILIFVFLCFYQSAGAVSTVPTQMNFQGKLTDAAGEIVADGSYNMKLRLYDASTGGALQWSEDRLVSASQGVSVTNGVFAVQLGSISSLSAGLFDGSPTNLYLEVELPTPATATSASPSWTEGAMTPRNQLATSAYAFNSEMLDGFDSSDFGKLASANLFTAANSIDVSSASAFQVKNGLTNLFNVNTSSSVVTIGATDSTGVALVLDTKNTSGDPTGVVGGMYYNSNSSKFRCYQGAAWADCIGAGGGGGDLQSAYTAMGGGTTPEIKLDATRGGLDIQDADSTIGNPLLSVRTSNGSGLGTAVFSVGHTGNISTKTTTNSTFAFDIQNSSSSSLFKVDTTNGGLVTILGNTSGEVGSWATTSGTAAPRPEGTAVSANGYMYLIGGFDGSATYDSVYYAKILADGSLDTWQATTSLPQERAFHGSIVANGYLYVIGGDDSSNVATDTVYYARLKTDGTVGSWQTTTVLSNPRSDFGIATSNGYVYVVGGLDDTGASNNSVLYAKLKTDGTIGNWIATNSLSSSLSRHSTVVASGYIYAIGGYDGFLARVTDEVEYAKLNIDGTVDSWQVNPNDLPSGIYYNPSAVANGYLYTEQAGFLHYAKLNTDGSTGTFATASNTTGAAGEGSMVVVNGRIYYVGAWNETDTYYTQVGGVLRVGGALDLVGLQGQNLADAGDGSFGSSGGSITAGNIRGVGSLQIQGHALFSSGVGIAGDISVGDGLFGVDTESNIVRIGPSAADGTGVVMILDTKNTSGDPSNASATNGAMYYNSSLKRFRCYENGQWRNCTGIKSVSNTTATQSVTAGTDTYLTGSTVTLPSYGLSAPDSGLGNGTLVTWRVYLSKTAAGTAASTLTLRIGTAGTTADTSRCTAFGTGTPTAAADGGVITVTVYATGGGASATLNCSFTLTHQLPTTGLANTAIVQSYSSSGSFDSTPSGTKMGLSFNAGTGSTITIQKVESSVENL